MLYYYMKEHNFQGKTLLLRKKQKQNKNVGNKGNKIKNHVDIIRKMW